MPKVTYPPMFRPATAAMLLTTALLSACGGGGSGGGAAVSPSFPLGSAPSATPQDLTTLPVLTEVQVNAVTTASVEVGTGYFLPLSVTPRIGIRTQAGDVQEIALQVPELAVAQTFVRGTSLATDPVSGSFPFNWATGSRTSGVQQFEIDIIDPDTAGLRYHSFGTWGRDANNTSFQAVALGYLTIGTPTLGSSVPTSGTASYTGVMNAIYTTSGLFDDVTAQALASVNFATRSINFSTTGSVRQPAVGNPGNAVFAAPTYNMSGTLNYALGSNAISGTVTTGTGLTGTVTANFFGPTAQEIGGTFVLQDGGATTRMMGAFGVHQ